MDDYINALHHGLRPDPENNVFNDIWGEYERVVLHSVVTTFGLDFIIDQDVLIPLQENIVKIHVQIGNA